jgi:predicted PurR-regulated permease PerM
MHVDWRRVLVVELALLAGCALAYVGWLVLQRFLHTVLLFLFACVLAFALGPLVARAEVRTGRRGLAVAAVYLGLVLVVAGGLFLLARPFVSQATALLSELPRYADVIKAQAPALDARLQQAGLPVSAQDLQSKGTTVVEAGGAAILGSSIAVLTGLTGVVVDLVLVLVMSLYLVIDGPRLRVAWLRLIPTSRRESAFFVEETVTRVAGGYLRGQLTMALTIGVLAGLGAVIFQLHYPVVVGVLAGVMELVPMFGPILGAIPALLLALFNPFPTVVWVALYFLAIQQIESNVLGPRITGHAVGLHPLGALLALLAGFELAGLFGALFAVPVVGILWVLISAIYHRLRYGEDEPPAPRRGWPSVGWRGIPIGRPAAPPADQSSMAGPRRPPAA